MTPSDYFMEHFEGPETIYKFLVEVGANLVQKNKNLAAMFKAVQNSFSDLVYHIRILYEECKDLELLKDFY